MQPNFMMNLVTNQYYFYPSKTTYIILFKISIRAHRAYKCKSEKKVDEVTYTPTENNMLRSRNLIHIIRATVKTGNIVNYTPAF
jgi:hypothetical protein